MQHRPFTVCKRIPASLLLVAVLTIPAESASCQGQLGPNSSEPTWQAPAAASPAFGWGFRLGSPAITYQLPSSPLLLSVGSGDTATVQPVPEPSSGVILLAGAATLAVARARIRKSRRESSESRS
jgi:hypothetical protein